MPPDSLTAGTTPLPTQRPSIATLRDRLVSQPAFRRWAARFPLTRPIARRRTQALFDLCAGFVYAQILAACVQLRVFDHLRPGPLPASQLATLLALPPDAATRLLDAAVALSLLERRAGGTYGLGPLGAAMVGNEAVLSMVTHHAMLYADLADPVSLLRGQAPRTQLSTYWTYARAQAEAHPESSPAEHPTPNHGQTGYTALMAASQALVAGEILDACPLGRHTRLLDVGGGDGSFLRAAHQRHPHLQLMLFDLPPVAATAAQAFAQAGIPAQITPGSFRTDPLPQGADIISLVRVVHDHDDDLARHLLHQAWLALPPGGTLLLAEPMADTPGARRMGDAYFGFYLLAMGSGRPRTATALTAMLKSAGFARVKQLATNTPLLTSILRATKG